MKFTKIITVILAFIAVVLLLPSCTKKYEVSFNTNGGSELASVSVAENVEYTLPTPTKDGYEFTGWYENENLSGEALYSLTNLSENKTLYASWAELAKITLDAGSGTLAESYVYARVGEEVLTKVQNLTPTLAGAKFGGWYIGSSALTSSTKLTSKGITLTAKYQSEYTVNVYKQKVTLDGYDLESVKGYEFIGKTYSQELEYPGFTEVTKEDSIDEITINQDSSKNILNVYYDRDEYKVTFRSNYPTDKEEETESISVVYGEDKTLPTVSFECEGYYLLGWSLSSNGDIVYDAHYIDNLPINGEKTSVEMPKLEVSRNTSLYAVWNKGYRDMFGGSDYIFTSGEDTVYLCRGGIYFVGEYFENNEFIFYNDYENIEGRLFEDETFAYYNAIRDGKIYTLYEVGTGLVEDVTIYFDAYNGLTYNVKENGKNNSSTGTYTIEDGYYIATFTTGDFAGEEKTIIIGTVSNSDGSTSNAFQLRNDNEYEMGKLVRFVVYNGQITYYTTAYDITLTGFGVASYNQGTSTTSYYYTYDEETSMLTLLNSSGSSVGIAKVMEYNGTLGYVFYNEDLDVSYNNDNDDSLILDGTFNAEYISDAGTVTGYYTTSSSNFGTIVTLQAGGTTYTFLTYTKTVTEEVGDTEKSTTTYHFILKNNSYAEYYYKDAKGTYYAPLFVIDDEEVGKINIYGYTQNKEFVKAATGTYTQVEGTTNYLFTTTEVYETEALTSPYDITKIKSVIFALDSSSTSYSINYWYSLTLEDSEEQSFDVTYQCESEKATLVLVSGMAIYSRDGYVITGTYATKNGLTTITAPSGYLYLELDDDNLSFITLSYKPYSAYVLMEDGSASKYEYVTFDGKGGAVYTYYETEEVEGEEQSVKKDISGTITETADATKQGFTIYEFKSDTKNFKYISVTVSSTTYVLPYYGNVYGTYTSESDGILYVDGFGYYASYTDPDGNEYANIYTLSSDNVIRLAFNGVYRYFDLKDHSFTLRGAEYGTYIVMDNVGFPGKYISLDGYGNAKIFTNEKDEESSTGYKQVYIDENATYTILGDEYILAYNDGEEAATLCGNLSTYTYNSNTYNTFVVRHEEAVYTFVNSKDWSILILDPIGGATKYDNKGNSETGTYLLITDSLLYYYNDDATEANIYKYNTEKGTIVASEFTARGYYTKDLKSLLFSQYGFMIFNNETRYYYAMDGNDVIVYHQDPENSQANKYGFVEENFGEFLNVKTFHDVTYYENDGNAIHFSRVEDTKDLYPVTVSSVKTPLGELTFAPSGSDEFSVTGSVKLNGSDQSCTVVRKVVDGKYEMYILVGAYRFDITATYNGKDENGNSNNTYEIIAMSYDMSFYPYSYLSTLYMYYSFFGSSILSYYQNNLGMMYLHVDFDAQGEETANYMIVDFYDGTKALDLNGAMIESEKAEYSYDSSTHVYMIEIEGTDGYLYRIRYIVSVYSAFNVYAYRLYAVTRVETLTDGDYQLEIERIITTDYGYDAGTVFTMKLTSGEDELKYNIAYVKDGVWSYVYRTFDENSKLTSTTYYEIKLTEKASSSVGEETEDSVVEPYESVKITKKECVNYFAENGTTYVDIVDGNITVINLDGSFALVTECTYDEATKTYSITVASGSKYTVTIGDNNIITVRDVIESEE